MTLIPIVFQHELIYFILQYTRIWSKNCSVRNELIKLICLRSEFHVASFWICMDTTFFSESRFNNFLLIDATDRSKIRSDQKRLSIVVTRTLPTMKKRMFFIKNWLFFSFSIASYKRGKQKSNSQRNRKWKKVWRYKTGISNYLFILKQSKLLRVPL